MMKAYFFVLFFLLMIALTFQVQAQETNTSPTSYKCLATSHNVPIFDNLRHVVTLSPLVEKVGKAVVEIVTDSRTIGSGLLIDTQQKYILTNYHVVDDYLEGDLFVKIQEHRQKYQIKIVGSDPQIDLSLLQMRLDQPQIPQSLTALALGDSDCLKVGDVVMAIGYPMHTKPTVTFGIISALGRSDLNWTSSMSHIRYQDFIQIDAPLNKGNSGGALVNTYGELVGINTGIRRQTEGIGFAIPVNMARTIVNQILKYGEVQRGSIGIWVESNPDGFGPKIVHVNPESLAQEAGLQEDDEIVAINGQKISSVGHLQRHIHVRERDQVIVVRYYRPKLEQFSEQEIRIGAPPEKMIMLGQKIHPRFHGGVFTDHVLEYLKESVQGVSVLEVELDSPAYQSGLRKDDIILSINTLLNKEQKKFISLLKFRTHVQYLTKGEQIVQDEKGSPIYARRDTMELYILRNFETFVSLDIPIDFNEESQEEDVSEPLEETLNGPLEEEFYEEQRE